MDMHTTTIGMQIITQPTAVEQLQITTITTTAMMVQKQQWKTINNLNWVNNFGWLVFDEEVPRSENEAGFYLT